MLEEACWERLKEEVLDKYKARSVYWKKWAAKHEYEELNEGAWLEPGLAVLRKKEKGIELKIIEMWPGRLSWKVDGRKRAYPMLIGRTPVNVKLARKRKEQKSTGFSTAQNGTKSDERFQKLVGSGNSWREPQRRSGSGKEVL